VIKTTYVHHPIIGNAHVYMQLSKHEYNNSYVSRPGYVLTGPFSSFFYGTSSPILGPIIWMFKIFDAHHFRNELKSV
jgi:hypothetical protein